MVKRCSLNSSVSLVWPANRGRDIPITYTCGADNVNWQLVILAQTRPDTPAIEILYPPVYKEL